MHRYLFLISTAVSLCTVQPAALAQEVDWSTSFLFRTLGGFGAENPLFRVAFDPKDYPPDPVMPTLVDLSEPTMLTLTIPDIRVTEGAARILFAVEEEFFIDAEGLPEDGIFEFETVGQGVQNFSLNLSTGSGAIPLPGSWQAFNPQPEPPAGFVGMGFDFQFSSFSPATLVLQMFDDGVEPFSFELIASTDFDTDGDVDDVDLAFWTEGYSSSASGDANLNGLTDGDDYLRWQRQYTGPAGITAVPEPTAATLVFFTLATYYLAQSRGRSS